MHIPQLLEGLNEAQRAAVTAPHAPVLVLAGAGCGKTRVLTARLAWLIQAGAVPPEGVLAVTFTNKAAAEIRSRIASLLGPRAADPWLGTFHGIAHRILRRHPYQARLPQAFQILDAEDQLRCIQQLMRPRDCELQALHIAAPDVANFINRAKDAGQRPQHLQDHNDPRRRELLRLYRAYQQRCERRALLDFGELLLRACELWLEHPELLNAYRARFRHVLVDEFQDTNTVQYRWLRLLAAADTVPYVVGDDDQSIYSWRGAKPRHLQQLPRDYPNALLYRLERNYRSTPTILEAANALIARNRDRLGKTLWTEGAPGAPIDLHAACDECAEAELIAQRILLWLAHGGSHRQIAILYRANACSRVLEEALIGARIPYHIHGALRFFERTEIKDALAYLRLILHPQDDFSFERVVNVPPRGVGPASLELIRERAAAAACSLWEAAMRIEDTSLLGRKATAGLHAFLALIERLALELPQRPLHQQLEQVLQDCGLMQHHASNAPERAENLAELISAARSFAASGLHEELPPLHAFLAHAVLEGGEAREHNPQAVQLMTLHASKGLEFPLVFITGLCEGRFPSPRALEERAALEEERRLFYVGVTRAMDHLCLTYPQARHGHPAGYPLAPSRFIAEIPARLIQNAPPLPGPSATA